MYIVHTCRYVYYINFHVHGRVEARQAARTGEAHNSQGRHLHRAVGAR